ncbi:MAG: alpha/beta hydrolase [Candidatus Woesebacteria bacterium]|jgi:pimeloyl-ACP methyl ester carboxylesterase
MKKFRKYGTKPFKLALLHGGPGAAGEMAAVAKELSKEHAVLEPLQSKTSIQGQVEELKAILQTNADLPVTLIGYSWGAWLAFIFAAQYPKFVKKLILLGSGAFEEKYAKDIMKVRLARLSKAERKEVDSLSKDLERAEPEQKNAIFAQFGKLMTKADSYNPLPDKNKSINCRYDIYEKVWPEAAELRRTGKLLKLGKKIQCPVVAIHGDYEPHLPEGVRVPLAKVLKDFKFILLKKCGHTVWLEKEARAKFYALLKKEL